MGMKREKTQGKEFCPLLAENGLLGRLHS